MLSCAYRSTEEIINQSRVDTRLTREDGHLQHGWWGGSSHTSETNNNYILIVNSPRLLFFPKVRTEVEMIYGRVRICIRVGGERETTILSFVLRRPRTTICLIVVTSSDQSGDSIMSPDNL